MATMWENDETEHVSPIKLNLHANYSPVAIIFFIFHELRGLRIKMCLNLPASGALSVFSWMREPHVSETHVACIHLEHKKKEIEKKIL